MKITEKITALAVMTFITVSAGTVLFGKNGIPQIDKKSVSDGTYADKLTEFTAEAFPFREKLRSLGAEITVRTGEPVINGVYITDEHLLSVDTGSPDKIDNATAKINEFAESYGGAVYFAVIPTSAGIYGDVLPSYYIEYTEKQQADRLYEGLSADIRKIDAYTILKMMSDNYIYYRSDRKWTSYGAYCVYRTVIQKLGFIPVSYDKYTIFHVSDSYRGDLYGRTNYMEGKPDILDIYEYDDGTEITSCIGTDSDNVERSISLYDTEAVDSGNPYELYLGEDIPLIKIKTTVNNDRKLLVIGDEFADCFIPFLTKHYSEIAFVSVKFTENGLEKYITPDDYEQTLFIVGIDTIN